MSFANDSELLHYWTSGSRYSKVQKRCLFDLSTKMKWCDISLNLTRFASMEILLLAIKFNDAIRVDFEAFVFIIGNGILVSESHMFLIRIPSIFNLTIVITKFISIRLDMVLWVSLLFFSSANSTHKSNKKPKSSEFKLGHIALVLLIYRCLSYMICAIKLRLMHLRYPWEKMYASAVSIDNVIIPIAMRIALKR